MAAVEGYTELYPLGSGGSGSVVVARNDATGELVAIKRLSQRLVRDARFREQFRAEAEILRQLRHPNIAALHWYEETDRDAALAMELVNGVPLRRILEQGPTIPEAALVVLRGSLQGLDHAHGAGIIHRDYKPENVVVDGTGVSRLIDFGIAVPIGGRAFLAGTPRYMAPEQWQGAPPSPQTDVYATAAVFFEALTGRPPFDATTLSGLREQHVGGHIPVEDVPAPVRGLVSRGLAKDPADRPASAGQFVGELGAAALAGYGPGWAERGTKRLAEAALALVALFPLELAAGAAAGGTAAAATVIGASEDGEGGPGAPTAAGAAGGAGWLRGWQLLLAGASVVAVGGILLGLGLSHAGPFRSSTSITPPLTGFSSPTPSPEVSSTAESSTSSSSPPAGIASTTSTNSPSGASTANTQAGGARITITPATPLPTSGTTQVISPPSATASAVTTASVTSTAASRTSGGETSMTTSHAETTEHSTDAPSPERSSSTSSEHSPTDHSSSTCSGECLSISTSPSASSTPCTCSSITTGGSTTGGPFPVGAVFGTNFKDPHGGGPPSRGEPDAVGITLITTLCAALFALLVGSLRKWPHHSPPQTAG